MSERGPIVVGVDGGEASVAALEFAVREAQLRGTHVVAVSCWPAIDRRDDSGPLRCSTYKEAAGLVEHVISEAAAHTPESVHIVREIEQADAGVALVHASRDAAMLVLGSTTRGPHGHHHGRHTLEHCLLYAESPVVVVPWFEARLDQTDIDLDLHQVPAT